MKVYEERTICGRWNSKQLTDSCSFKGRTLHWMMSEFGIWNLIFKDESYIIEWCPLHFFSFCSSFALSHTCFKFWIKKYDFRWLSIFSMLIVWCLYLQCFSSYSIEEVAFSFNGGKDSTVCSNIYYLLLLIRIYGLINDDSELWHAGFVAHTQGWLFLA